MSAHCLDCVACEVEGCDAIAFCLADRPDSYPCQHDRALCSTHNLTDCIDCRLEAEGELYAGNTYDPTADPFFRHTAAAPVDRIARDGGYEWLGSWVEVKRNG